MAENWGGGFHQHPGAITGPMGRRLAQNLLIILTILFAVQIFSPLRLNTDAIVLLSLGDSLSHGGSLLYSGHATVFPPGYPALLSLMMRLGLAHSWSLISLNILLLSAGLLFGYYWLLWTGFFNDTAIPLFICAFSLLSFVVIKHFSIPLTDVPYFFCSMFCLAAMCKATNMDLNWRCGIVVVSAWLLGVAAIAVRGIGIALVPSLVFVTANTFGIKAKKILSIRTKLAVYFTFILIIGVITYAFAINSRQYTLYFLALKNASSIFTLFMNSISYRISELGEMAINIPLSRTPVGLHRIISWIGLSFFLMIAIGITYVVLQRKKMNHVEVYLFGYAAILFIWPYYDTRFWLPVIPILITYLILGAKNLRLPTGVCMLYCLTFATLGFAGIAYSTGITFAGSAFPERYGDGALRPTYCAALESCRYGDDRNKVDANALNLLRKYN